MKPKVICHMIESVDGRLHPSRWSKPVHEIDISAVYESYAARFSAQAWMVGRTTLAEFDDVVEERECAVVAKGETQAHCHNAKADDETLAIVLDPKGKLHYKDAVVSGKQHILTIVGKGVNPAYLKELEETGVSYIVPEDINDLSEVLDTLASVFGVETLLLEGGGVINGAFINAGLVDELSVLVYPAIDGLFGTPSIIGYKPADGSTEAKPAAKTHLELLNTEVNKSGLVWLHYAMNNEA